jgi:hypothetical protein
MQNRTQVWAASAMIPSKHYRAAQLLDSASSPLQKVRRARVHVLRKRIAGSIRNRIPPYVEIGETRIGHVPVVAMT